MRRYRRITVPLIALFLVAHAICVCTAPAAVGSDRVTASADPHACCHARDTAPAQHESAPRCLHCTHTVLAAPDTTRSTIPAAIAMPLLALTTSRPVSLVRVARALPSDGGGGFTRPTWSQTSVLRL